MILIHRRRLKKHTREQLASIDAKPVPTPKPPPPSTTTHSVKGKETASTPDDKETTPAGPNRRQRQRQLRKEKLQEAHLSAALDDMDEALKDDVQFNEVVQEPPRLTAVPKNRYTLPAPKPKPVPVVFVYCLACHLHRYRKRKRECWR